MPKNRSAHSIDLEQPEGPPLHVHYELTTWTERHEFGEEYYSEVNIIWTSINGHEVPIPPGTEEQVLDAIR